MGILFISVTRNWERYHNTHLSTRFLFYIPFLSFAFKSVLKSNHFFSHRAAAFLFNTVSNMHPPPPPPDGVAYTEYIYIESFEMSLLTIYSLSIPSHPYPAYCTPCGMSTRRPVWPSDQSGHLMMYWTGTSFTTAWTIPRWNYPSIHAITELICIEKDINTRRICRDLHF